MPRHKRHSLSAFSSSLEQASAPTIAVNELLDNYVAPGSSLTLVADYAVVTSGQDCAAPHRFPNEIP